MLATERVINDRNETIGFFIDNMYYPEVQVRKGIEHIENLYLLGNMITSKTKLPEKDYSFVLNRLYEDELNAAPFTREIQKSIEKWKSSGTRRILQLNGSISIGKTSEVMKFAYKNYETVIYVNLEDCFNSIFKSILKEVGCNSLGIQKYCESMNDIGYKDSKSSVLIIDEVQLDSEVYNMLGALHRNLLCDIIVVSNYMENILEKENFKQLDNMECLTMYPLSFSEFVGVFNEGDTLMQLELFGTSAKSDYEKLNTLYSLYKEIGGYPEIVKEYIKYSNVDRCMQRLENLLIRLNREGAWYFGDSINTQIFNCVFEVVCRFMCRKDKSTIEELIENIKCSINYDITREETINIIYWFKQAGILGFCDDYNSDVNTNKFDSKIYILDCGLASIIYCRMKCSNIEKQGSLTEIFAFSELCRLCTAPSDVKVVYEDSPCFIRSDVDELDFVLTDKCGMTYGIGVKETVDAGLNTHKSLVDFLKDGKIDTAVFARETSGGMSSRMTTVPIYTVGARFPYKQRSL